MRSIITITLIVVSFLGYSQDYNFKPKWKVGDSKKITISKTEREYEDDSLISDTTTYNHASLLVLEEDSETYTLEILFENQALIAAIEFYDKLGEELKEYKDLKLIYAIDKETAETELLNWKEAQQFMTSSFKQITSIISQKVPDVTPIISAVFMPLQEMFKTKENMEGYMETNIGYLFVPFNTNYKVGETISVTESQENPLNPAQEISATTLTTLQSVHTKSKTCVITQEVELDMTEFIEMMKGMIQMMAKSMGASDSSTASKTKEMDDFEMDITNVQEITFNYKSTWVTKVVATGGFNGTDPKTGIRSKKEAITTTLIK